MSVFKSWRSYWNFESSTKRERRYIRTDEEQAFLDTVLATSKSREDPIPAGSVLWRAQLGYEFKPTYEDDELIGEEPRPHNPDRMKPIPGQASEGRANPKGIPYLYLATHRDTALAEVRPWIGSLISVAQFKIVRDLVVINCTLHDPGNVIYFEEPEPEKRETAVWSHIDRAFSVPVTPSDRAADYVPTQIIVELFKGAGHDGIAYASALGEGHNIALFDLEAAELINCNLYQVKRINFEFEQAANPYFVKKHYK